MGQALNNGGGIMQSMFRRKQSVVIMAGWARLKYMLLLLLVAGFNVTALALGPPVVNALDPWVSATSA